MTYKLSRSDKRKWIPAFAGMTVGGETTIGVIPRNEVTTRVISMSEAKRNLRRLFGLRLLPDMRRVEVTKKFGMTDVNLMMRPLTLWIEEKS